MSAPSLPNVSGSHVRLPIAAMSILRFSRLVLDRRDEAMDLIQLESGKARFSAFEEVADLGLNAPALCAPRSKAAAAAAARVGAFPVITSVPANCAIQSAWSV